MLWYIFRPKKCKVTSLEVRYLYRQFIIIIIIIIVLNIAEGWGVNVLGSNLVAVWSKA